MYRVHNAIKPYHSMDHSTAHRGKCTCCCQSRVRAVRQARLDQPRCVLLAPNARDAAPLLPQSRLTGDKGEGHAEGGWRCLQAPRFLNSALDLNKPERLMALLLVMTVSLWV
jgi:hypothetical protein